MNKAELIKRIVQEADLSKTVATAAVDSFCHIVTKCLSDGEKVALLGFGSFSVKEVKARKARNPRTGEVMNIEAHKRVHFTAGQSLRDSINH